MNSFLYTPHTPTVDGFIPLGRYVYTWWHCKRSSEAMLGARMPSAAASVCKMDRPPSTPRSPTEGSALQVASWSTTLAKERALLQEAGPRDVWCETAMQPRAQPSHPVRCLSGHGFYLHFWMVCLSHGIDLVRHQRTVYFEHHFVLSLPMNHPFFMPQL